MEKVSIYTIAQRLGVSAATVSRALSGKGRVSPELRQRVAEVARELNYQPNRLARRLSASDISIVVFYGGMQFDEFGLDIFRGAYDACMELSDYHVKVRLCYFPQVTQQFMRDEDVEHIVRILESGVHGAINLLLPEDGARRERILEAVRRHDIALADVVCRDERTEPVFAYQSDSYTAGAMAAELLWNALGDGGKVSIFTAQKDSAVHGAGIRGFQDAVRRYPLNLCAVYENYDDRNMAYYAADALLRNHPDVLGIFVASANSRMVCQRIAESDCPERYCLVTSDLYPELVPYIDRRIVRATIVQQQYTQAFETFRTLANYLITHTPPETAVRTIRPQIVLRSNVNQYLEPESDKHLSACRAAIEYF